MQFFAFVVTFACLLSITFAHQSDFLQENNFENERQQRHDQKEEQTRLERGTFRSPNSNMNQNPDKGPKVKRGVSRFGQAPIEREMTGNVSPVEAARTSGAFVPTYAAAQPVPVPVAGVQSAQAIPVGRKKRATSRNLPVEVGIGPGQSR